MRKGRLVMPLMLQVLLGLALALLLPVAASIAAYRVRQFRALADSWRIRPDG